MLNGWIILILTVLALSDGGIAFAATKKTNGGKSHTQQKRMKINSMSDYDGAWIANIETDVYRAGTFENIHLGYSANKGWDFSFSLLNVQVIGGHNRFQGEPFANIAKTFAVDNRYSIAVSSSNGLMIGNAQPQSWLNFNFLDNRYGITPSIMVHGGPYLANAAITGTVRQIGFLAGIGIDFIPNKLTLQMDYISGHHNLSGANVNMLFNLTPRCQIYLGVLVPEQHSGNEFAGIVGFNISTHQL